MKVYNKSGSKERLFEMMQGVNKVKLNESRFIPVVGQRVKIADGSGVDSNKTGVVVSQSEVKTNGRGIPVNIQGAYKPIDWNREVAIRLDDGELITMFLNRILPLDNDVNENITNEFNRQNYPELVGKKFPSDKVPSYARVKPVDSLSEQSIEHKEESDPFGGTRQKYQDGSGYGDEKPVNPKLRVKAPELDKFISESEDLKQWDRDIIKQAYINFTKKNGNKNPRLSDLQREISLIVSMNESTDQDKYEDVVFMQGEEADEPLNILMNQGQDEALEYLKQWHDPGHHMGRNDIGHGSSDFIYEKDGYIMSWNPYIGYIGLVYDLSNLNESDDGEDIIKSKFKSLNADLDFSRMSDAYQKLLKIKHGEFRSTDVLQQALSALRDSITKYLNGVKGINVDSEDVQNWFTNQAQFSSLMENDEEDFEEKEPEKTEVPALDVDDVDQDGDKIEGGLADNENVDQYDPDQILKGIEVEMEHTKDPKIALEIAMDHLEELPDYYTRLDDMEKEGEADLESLDGDDEISDVEKENPELYPDGWKEMDGMFMNPDSPIFKHAETLKDADKQLEDTLLGYDTETPNANEEQTFASREVEYADMDVYKRFQELENMAIEQGFENLTPELQDEYYELWLEFGKSKV